MTRAATTSVLTALLLAAFAGLAVLLLPASAGAVTATDHGQPPVVAATALPPGAVAPAQADAPDAFLAALLGPATDLAPGQAETLTAAADRVCEGFTAGVPVVVMADRLSAELGLTDEEARHLVNTAGTVHCR